MEDPALKGHYKFFFLLKNFWLQSLNTAYSTRDKTHYSVKTRKWIKCFKDRLAMYPSEISEIRKTYRKVDHFLTVQYIQFMPEAIFFTKAGHINERHGDWSNWPKISDDVLFMETFHIDDAHVQRGWVEKLPIKGKKWHLKILVEIRPMYSLKERVLLHLPNCLREAQGENLDDSQTTLFNPPTG